MARASAPASAGKTKPGPSSTPPSAGRKRGGADARDEFSKDVAKGGDGSENATKSKNAVGSTQRGDAKAPKRGHGGAGAAKGDGEATAAKAGGTPGQLPAKKKTSEIDDLFAAIKTSKASDAASKSAKAAAEEPSAKRPKVVGSKDDIFGEEEGGPRKRTEEGYRIFSEEELGLLKTGGDTDSCPFDCDCCF